LRDYFNSEFKSINIKRLNDLKAFSKREKFLLSAKNDNYLEELKTKIDFRLNNKKEFNRIFSLVNKVNQFIFNYKRFNKTQVKEYYKNSNKFVFTISLKDKFSDSGNIGVIFFSKINNIMYLDELCISCRALGRNLENYFIFYPLQILSKKIKFDKVFINFKRGAKNKPAETYFGILHKKFFNKKLIKTRIEIPISQINQDLIKNSNISVSFKN
jgi:FkbH-like protein